MFWEKKLAQWVEDVKTKANLPARLVLWDGQQHDFGQFAAPQVTLHVKSATALPYLLEPSLDNLGEAYVKGKIDIEGKLSDIINISYQLARNTVTSASKLARVRRYFHHSKSSDKKAIQYHYDVSNEFYKLWLDENMVYSCAYFENGDEDLATAQIKKIDHILTKIQLQPGQRLLDIGCGWGALVLRAAQKFGAKCVGVTLSQNQFDLATARVKAAGLEDQIEIRLQDYRDVQGQFDRITSVGMFEHVGRKNLPGYFEKIHDLLVDDGMAMNHGITSSDSDSGETALGGGEFIDRYVFPDGELPHIGLALEAMQRGGLEAVDVESLRRHYAHTLDLWAENFEAHADEARTARRRREIPHLARVSRRLRVRVRNRRRVDLSGGVPQSRPQRENPAVVAPLHVRQAAVMTVAPWLGAAARRGATLNSRSNIDGPERDKRNWQALRLANRTARR